MKLVPIWYSILNLLLYDLIFLCVVLVVVALLAATKQAAFAVMKRNFFSYFSNPTGYVFLCIFVFLTSVAAFWPYEFFNQNLATLDQLNKWFPLIMLIFIPAITMSIWAEEKRAGTDELLLTLPADDFDIVIGKYMSAAAIFTASLVFSQVSTFLTLSILTQGELDTGLIFTSYVGYWFIGLAMLAIGMVASFMTGNLTVGFILGALFNAPLAFASLISSMTPSERIAGWIEASGIARPFDDFGRGVISTSSLTYFILVAVVALYACMVLIGRRHWTGGKDGNTMAWHYLTRIASLALITVGAVMLFRTLDVFRGDFTDGKVSSLAPATQELIRNLDDDRPVIIDAFISSDIPEVYAKTRYELITLLKEFRSEAKKNGREIKINIYDDIELFSEEAELAEERFKIMPQTRLVREKGAPSEKKIIMGAAFRSGLQKVVVPIFEYGIPVEYELVRSIETVASERKLRLGVVKTDANMMGGRIMSGMSFQQIDTHPLIGELSKQYEVESVDLNTDVTPGMYDALLAVQPSSLSPPQFERLMDAIRAGVPTAIFEDPAPTRPYITPTSAPKQAPGGGMFGGGGPQPKGEIRDLWELLGIEVPGKANAQGLFEPDFAWQGHNPYPALEDSANELWVFVDEDANPEPGQALSSESVITSGMNEVLAIFTSAVKAVEGSPLRHTELLRTNANSGLINATKVRDAQRQPGALQRALQAGTGDVCIAMSIEGEAEAKAEDSEESADSPAGKIKAVYVGDTDMMLDEFLMIRADPDTLTEARFQFQNVSFILNCIDWLTGQTGFIEVRKHEPIFPNLKLIDMVKDDARTQVNENRREFQRIFDEAEVEAQEAQARRLQSFREELEDLTKKLRQGEATMSEYQALQQKVQTKEREEKRRLDVLLTKLKGKRDKDIRRIEKSAQDQVTKIQNNYKAAAVVFPCIPPLIVGLVVFASRRLRERDNITKARLK